jgi:MrfA Zn-binding domain
VRDRSQIGELRPSQLMHTYGVGATVELPELTTLVLELDDWPRALGEPVSEPRLLAAVRAAVGSQVEQLLTPPVVPEGDSSGVPVAPFPRWLRCPVCSRLAPIDHGVFTLKVDPWRPERTKYVHEGCPKTKATRPPTAFPARYMMACDAGHLDDFPWVEFLHGSLPCQGTLKLIELGSSGRAGDVQLQCDECGRRRRLSQAFGEDSPALLPPRCRGRHPHLGISEHCQLAPATLLLGASNAWFPVQSSALAIPSQASELAQRIDEAWATLSIYPPGLEILDANLKAHPDLKDLRPLAEKLGVQAVHDAIEARREGLQDGEVEDLLTPEWRVLSAPDEAPDQPDFKLRPVGPPAPLAGVLADVVLVERLREVSALRGFTRINAPDELGSQGGTIVRLSREPPKWLHCSEVRGEGIFIRFREEAVLDWEARYRESGAARVLREANRTWRERRGLDGDEGWPGERYVLLHSFAHALIRELALECGYTASSIRERLYATSPGDDGEPTAGVLLYTAAPDSEGTLGGLVSLGERDQLGPLLHQALERAQLCSSDPLCSEHDPRTDASVHAAACHACQFASETSCERGNRFLDRATLVRTLGPVDVAYFPPP